MRQYHRKTEVAEPVEEDRRLRPRPRGKRLSTAALTMSGARNASDRLHPHRAVDLGLSQNERLRIELAA
jgi:hypothetical protein